MDILFIVGQISLTNYIFDFFSKIFTCLFVYVCTEKERQMGFCV